MKNFGLFLISLIIANVGMHIHSQTPSAAGTAHGVRNDLPQPYETQRSWGELPEGTKWAAVTAVEPSPDGRFIYVVHRCIDNSCDGRSEAPILKYDYDGNLLDSFGAGLFVFPHGATVDYEGNLWVTDARSNDTIGHQVFKFSSDGEVLLTLGQQARGGSTPELLFNPNDVVIDPEDGDIFVAESHRGGLNNRIVHYSSEGRFINQWGSKGSEQGELSEPHSIAMDSQGRLFVGDRENNRIQIFSRDGAFIDEWRQFGRPSGIFITPDDKIYVADSESGPDTGAGELIGIKKGIRIGSAIDGTVTDFIEDMEPLREDHSGAEGVGVDANGNVYGAVVRRQMLERHVLR
jgi:DNA-binding beta-propeller fold protein YncE